MLKHSLITIAVLGLTTPVWANEIEFDRPGQGFSTQTLPKGQVVWEQSLANTLYTESRDLTGQLVKQTVLNADLLLRAGLTEQLELQLGWQGPSWSKTKVAGQSVEDDGLGDVSVGLKHHIDLGDERLSMAVLAQAVLATGNDGFSEQDDRYRLGSTVSYIYDEDQNLNTALSMFYEVQDGRWRATAVPTLSYQFAPKWNGYSELIYSKAESLDYEYGLGSGVMYSVSPKLQLDASANIMLHGQNKNYQANLGFAYAF